jgi:hypothetical protein
MPGNNREKMMLRIAWTIRGFHLIGVIPKVEKYSAHYFIDKTLTLSYTPLIPTAKRKMVIHDFHTIHVFFAGQT